MYTEKSSLDTARGALGSIKPLLNDTKGIGEDGVRPLTEGAARRMPRGGCGLRRKNPPRFSRRVFQTISLAAIHPRSYS